MDPTELANKILVLIPHRDFPTVLKSGQGSVEFVKKAFGPSKLYHIIIGFFINMHLRSTKWTTILNRL